jgi:hypothetical protein
MVCRGRGEVGTFYEFSSVDLAVCEFDGDDVAL